MEGSFIYAGARSNPAGNRDDNVNNEKDDIDYDENDANNGIMIMKLMLMAKMTVVMMVKVPS